MKALRILSAVILISMFSMIACAEGWFDDDDGDYMGTWTVVNCDSYVSLRRRPDTSSDRVVKVPKWADVEAYAYNSKWFECYYNGYHGYILREYLTDRPAKYPDYPGNGSSGRYDLDDFGYRTVTTKGRGNLVFQSSPRGSFMSDYTYRNGDRIYVNLYWREDGYAIAYEDGVYGYVDASYINCTSGGGTSGGGSGERDLSDFEYKRVSTKGRGSLVFQTSPGGSFMSGYTYNDGDEIYVNVYWRKDGYAIAYENGVYGYVDASYINWNSGGSSGGGERDLSDFEYRRVSTKGRGNLVFQTSPGGSFMSGYKYTDGDAIYVNVYWRKDGYAIAYEDGVYGYVDASYIDW